MVVCHLGMLAQLLHDQLALQHGLLRVLEARGGVA